MQYTYIMFYLDLGEWQFVKGFNDIIDATEELYRVRMESTEDPENYLLVAVLK